MYTVILFSVSDVKFVHKCMDGKTIVMNTSKGREEFSLAPEFSRMHALLLAE